MSSNKIILESTQSSKRVELTANGDGQANIIIPTSEETFNFYTVEEVENLLTNNLSSTKLLPIPVITSPTNMETDYTGGVTFEGENGQYVLQGTPKKVTTIFEFSKLKDFSTLFYSKKISSTTVENLSASDLINKGFLSLSESGDPIDTYYWVRCKVVADNNSSPWSEPVAFQMAKSRYDTPGNITISLEEIPASDWNSTQKTRTSSLQVYTGNVIFSIDSPVFLNGSPGIPTHVEFYIEGNGNNISIKLPYDTETLNYKQRLIPFVMATNNTYQVKYRFINEENGIISPYSTQRDITIPKPSLKIQNLDIVNSLSSTAPLRTVGVDNVFCDFGLLDNIRNKTLFSNSLLGNNLDDFLNYFDTYSINYKFTITPVQGGTPYIKEFIVPIDQISNNFYKGKMFTVDEYTLYNGQQYEVKLELLQNPDETYINNAIEIITDEIPGDDFPMSDTLLNPARENNTEKLGFFGEVRPQNLMPENIRFRGTFKENELYKEGDEVVKDKKLYVCKQPTVNTTTPYNNFSTDFQEITRDDTVNYERFYKSGLPTYKWLAKEIGLPVGKTIKMGVNADLINETTCSPVINETEGWIKCYNKSNQIIYIAKKPIATDISYRELYRRFLTSHGSRTIRIGLNYYNVRLLEYSPTENINHKYKTDTEKLNIENEYILFKSLLNGSLANYQGEDLGIVDFDSITFTAKGLIRNTKSSARFNTYYQELDEDKFDNVDNLDLLNNDTNDIISSSVRNRITYYRPVLELIRENVLPFRNSIETPGPTNLQYDKWSDTGYYGKVSSSSFMTSRELKSMLGLTTLNVYDKDIFFYKFYYHGMTLYIPSKPIGNNIKHTELAEKDALFGFDTLNFNYYGNIKFKVGTININNTYYVDTENSKEEVINGQGTFNFTEKGIFQELLTRVLDINPLTNTLNLDKWETDLHNNDFTAVATKDVLHNKSDLFKLTRFTIDNNGDLKPKISEETETNEFWPVIYIDTLNYNSDLNYDEWNVKPAVVTYKTITVKKNIVTPEVVERERPVIKTRVEYEDRVTTVINKVPNGKLSFPLVEKTSNDLYGILLFHTPKTDESVLSSPLYDRLNLNVRKTSGKIAINYSTKYKDMKEFIVKSLLTSDKNNLVPKPLHISRFFPSSVSCRNFITDMVPDTYNIAVIKNYLSDVPLTSPDKTLPYGMMFGSLSSTLSYMPVSSKYEIYNPSLGVSNKLSLIPVIQEREGAYKNTWSTCPDINGDDVTIPILSSFITYDEFTETGRIFLDGYCKYLASNMGLKVDQANIEASMKTIRDQYVFGVLGVDLNDLYHIPGNGVLTGTYADPLIKTFDPLYRMNKYFGTDSSFNTSDGKDFVDLLNPKEGYDEVEQTTTTRVPITVTYTEMERYQETIYKEETILESIQVPVITYLSIDTGLPSS